ncbi:hypothetical protein FZC75_07020 [Sutcliffiella horikoshii]|uniref:Uncharacterized protein n=1 Tax=Sutcliffiella horikoshii TaxID=79883 RepID=A0A5D4TBT0_9BACI|nr:hypothetical protein FZC75_07020 [Sutcliffiella horikoshii]
MEWKARRRPREEGTGKTPQANKAPGTEINRFPQFLVNIKATRQSGGAAIDDIFLAFLCFFFFHHICK